MSNGGVKLLLIPTLAKKKLSLSLAVCLHLNRSKFLLMTVLLITGKKIFFFLKNIVLSPSLDVAHHAKVKVKSRKIIFDNFSDVLLNFFKTFFEIIIIIIDLFRTQRSKDKIR